MDNPQPLRPVLIVAGVLGGLLLVAVLVISLVLGAGDENAPQDDSTEPLAVPAVPAPKADSPPCTKLLRALPQRLVSNGKPLPARKLAAPAPKGSRAWGGDPAVVLRCGVPKPAALTQTSKLRAISGVTWLPVSESGSTTWYLVDRKVYVALTVPAGLSTGPLQQTSTAVREVLPRAAGS